jgi:hypothetical protein
MDDLQEDSMFLPDEEGLGHSGADIELVDSGKMPQCQPKAPC